MTSLNKRSLSAIVYFLVFSWHSVVGQQKRYSLQELTNAALQHYPLLKQDEAKIKTAEAYVTDIRHSYLPAMRFNDQINIGTDNSIAGGYLPLGIIPSVSAGVRANNISNAATGSSASFYSEYELYNFGLKKAKTNSAQVFVHIEQADMEQDKYALQEQVSFQYFNLIKSYYQLAADEDNVVRYSNINSVIEALVKSGLKSGADSSLSKAELSKAKTAYNNSAGNIKAIKLQLSYLTGVDSTLISVDTSVVLETKIDKKEYAINDSVHHPYIEFINQQKRLLLSNNSVIRKSYLPKLFIAGSVWARGSSIQYNDQFQSLNEGLGLQRFNYMAGISVSYDLFNNIRKKDKLAINNFQIQSVEKQLQQEQYYLKNNLMQAENAVTTSENNLQELPNQVFAATGVLQQKLAQYKAGLINLIDLTNAAFVLYRSKTDYIETLSNWYTARLQKAAASGKLDEFIQTIK
jgi:outer membrane protein TolC